MTENRRALAGHAGGHPADGEAPDVVVVVEVVDQHLQRRVLLLGRRRDVGQDGVEEGLQAVGLEGAGDGVGGASLAGDGVDDREVDLVLVGAQIDVERVHEVEDLLRPGVLPIDLVDHEHRGQPQRQGLGEHEAGLGQGPFGGVHEQEHAVHQAERPLHLAAEVGVARRVDDVDLDAAPGDRGVLGEDGDALLALQVVRVHHPLDQGLVGAEHTGLAEHVVHERGLAVVDVGDDGHVADAVSGDHGRGGKRAGVIYALRRTGKGKAPQEAPGRSRWSR